VIRFAHAKKTELEQWTQVKIINTSERFFSSMHLAASHNSALEMNPRGHRQVCARVLFCGSVSCIQKQIGFRSLENLAMKCGDWLTDGRGGCRHRRLLFHISAQAALFSRVIHNPLAQNSGKNATEFPKFRPTLQFSRVMHW
jgi:hypothetical protein